MTGKQNVNPRQSSSYAASLVSNCLNIERKNRQYLQHHTSLISTHAYALWTISDKYLRVR